MSNGPLVSVIVPAWNSERTLLETVQSVAGQTYRNLEILIIDDGSTDNTAALAEQFCATEPRASLVRKPNGGLSSARNRGIEEARGDWIAPIDADDLWHPTKIEKQIAVALAPGSPAGFVYCWYRMIDEAGRLLSSGPRLALSGSIFNSLAYMNAVQNGSALLISRQAALDVGGFDEDLGASEDVAFQLRMASRYAIGVVPEHLVGWRLHSSNMSSNSELMTSSARAVYEKLVVEGLLQRRLARWVMGRDSFNVAETRAAAGEPASAIGWLAASIWQDPVRNGMLLLYRMVRSVRRRLLGEIISPVPRPLFMDLDPAAVIETDPYAFPGIAAIVDRLDRHRLERLRILDAAASRLILARQAEKANA